MVWNINVAYVTYGYICVSHIQTNGSGFKIASGGIQLILFLRGSSHQKPQRYFWALQGYLFTISPEALSIKKDTWVRYSMFDAKLLKYIFRLLSQFAGGHCQGKLLIHPGSSEPHSEIIQSKILTFRDWLHRWPERTTSWGWGSTFLRFKKIYQNLIFLHISCSILCCTTNITK